jgi:RNase P/RNase MRP subunit p30
VTGFEKGFIVGAALAAPDWWECQRVPTYADIAERLGITESDARAFCYAWRRLVIDERSGLLDAVINSLAAWNAAENPPSLIEESHDDS